MRILLAIPFLAAAAHAGQVCTTRSFPSTPTNWAQTWAMPKHDPALGMLQTVTVTLRSTHTGTLSAENFGPVPSTNLVEIVGQGRVVRPDGSAIMQIARGLEVTLNLGAYDGTLDSGGTSGITLTNLQVSNETYAILASAADLALFTAASSGELIDLGIDASAGSSASGSGPLFSTFSASTALEITVCYGYREVRQSVVIPSSPTNWQQPNVFAKHDPALGPLRAVRVRARTTLSGHAGIESQSPAPALVSNLIRVQTKVQRPDASDMLVFDTAKASLDSFMPFDGTIDFAGTSGTWHAPGGAIKSGAEAILTSAPDLALFTAGSPGETIALSTLATGTSVSTGTGGLVTAFQTSAGVEIDLRYDYSAPVVPFCFGDGSGSSCPCGNASPAGAEQGCLNSLGLGGELRGTGAAEIGHDMLVLAASNLPGSTSVLFFQGTSATSVAFGDGLRCAGGAVRRLGRAVAAGGFASFPPPGQTVSHAGNASVGATLHYQAWYRNVAAFCTPSAFNLTNGLRITW